MKISSNDLLELYHLLKFPRLIEEKMLLLLRQGKLSKWFSGIGQEAISVGSMFALENEDVVFPMHRNLGVFTSRKVDLERLFSQLLGKEGGFTKGRDRTFHFGAMEYNIIGMISHLAAMLPVANGFALSYKLKKEKKVALSFIGEGATSEGDFHEAINLASVWNLPVIFLIENNGYGLSTPSSDQYNCKNLADRAKGYGIKGEIIDGNNVLEVYTVIKKYSDQLRVNPAPVIIEAKTFRVRGHEEASGIKYVPKKLINEWKKKDPILWYEKYLLDKKIINNSDIKEFEENKNREITSIIDKVLIKKVPISTVEKELNDVFSLSSFKQIQPDFNSTEIRRFVDAIKDGLFLKMKEDPSTIIMGQDIAEYGGVFKVTEGFIEEFGEDRVRNTPITESAVIGAALGMAMQGYKPIVEMQFADFVSNGFNQIVNNLAKTHYRWGKGVNVTLRLPTGAGIGAGPFHSQSNESWFFHTPGLKIVYPSNPYDAKGLLSSSIEDNNPVLYFEHKGLYRSIKEEIPQKSYNIELGKLKIVNEGSDLTIVTYGMGVIWAKEYLKNTNYSIELLDLRCLLPLDLNGILKSVKKTNKVLVLHEDNLTGGIGAEISALITEKCFEHLDAPVVRLCSIDTPIPFSSNIERDVYLPNLDIGKKINYLMKY